ncbi:RNA polymerase sigma factor [Knoellia sp. CPCC 206450]|uniref:RNA polymerase sigma factor n=1 Tax=Knoellia tibetensis TaxID=3404798 RepID=UPI003B42A11C
MAEPKDPTADVDLVNRLREGDEQAGVELWTRHYPAVLAAAKLVTRQPRDAEEIASDAFTGMLTAIASGAGPTTSVRGYLRTSVRNLAISRSQLASATEIITDDVAVLDRPVRDAPAHMSELQLVRVAFASLPRRWQVVLWRTAVDKDSNIEVGREMSLSPNGVAALARRARRGFRLAYLRAHLSDKGVAPECAPFIDSLADVAVSDTASTAEVTEHLDTCEKCAERLVLLRDADRNFAGLLGPAVLALVPAQRIVEAGGGGAATAPAVETTRAALPLLSRGTTNLALGSVVGTGAVVAALLALALPTSSAPAPPVAQQTSHPSAAHPIGPRSGLTATASTPPSRAFPPGGHRPPATATWHPHPHVEPTLAWKAQRRSPSPVFTASPETTPIATVSPTPTVTAADTEPPTPTASPTPTVTAAGTPTPTPTVTAAGTPTPTPSATPTSTVVVPGSQDPVVVTLSASRSRLHVKAAVKGTQGPLRLDLELPEGVRAVGERGAWRSCLQRARLVTCTTSPRVLDEWASTFTLVWFVEPRGTVRAAVSGTYVDGSPAFGSATATWDR